MLERINETLDESSYATFKATGHLNFNQSRATTNISTASRAVLDEFIRKTLNFVSLCKQSEDWLFVEFEIPSFALRKKLSWELGKIYRDKDLIFSQFSKDSPIFVVRKWKERDTTKVPKEIKVDVKDLEESDFDKYARGLRPENFQVLFEDDKCVVFPDRNPLTPAHFIVLAKQPRVCSLSKAGEEDEALLGHLMVVVAKVART